MRGLNHLGAKSNNETNLYQFHLYLKSNYKYELGLLHVYFFATTNLFRMASRADHTRQVDAQTCL